MDLSLELAHPTAFFVFYYL